MQPWNRAKNGNVQQSIHKVTVAQTSKTWFWHYGISEAAQNHYRVRVLRQTYLYLSIYAHTSDTMLDKFLMAELSTHQWYWKTRHHARITARYSTCIHFVFAVQILQQIDQIQSLQNESIVEKILQSSTYQIESHQNTARTSSWHTDPLRCVGQPLFPEHRTEKKEKGCDQRRKVA